MEWYRVNWNKLAVLLLPTSLRRLRMVEYISALFAPLQLLYDDFIAFRRRQLYEAEINGQVINLERVLNDTFDPIERRIYISDGATYQPPVFYEEFKNLPVVFYNEGNDLNPLFFSEAIIEDRVGFNFYVHVPDAVYSDKLRIKSVVNAYKAHGRIYDVVLIVNEE